MTENRYSQRRIDRIIDEGQVGEKISLFLRDRMGYFGQGFILNYDEIDRLCLSVVDIEDRREWVRQTSLGLRIENGFRDLNRTLDRVRGKQQNLLRTLSEIVEVDRLEDGLNRILSYQWTPVSEWVRQEICSLTGFSMLRPRLDPNKEINLGTEVEGGLMTKASQDREDIRSETRFFLCYEDSMMRKLDEFKLPVPEYLSTLSEMRGTLESILGEVPVRFRGEQDLREENIKERKVLRGPEKYPFPSLRGLIENYSVRPEDIDLNDEESMSLKNDILTRI